MKRLSLIKINESHPTNAHVCFKGGYKEEETSDQVDEPLRVE